MTHKKTLRYLSNTKTLNEMSQRVERVLREETDKGLMRQAIAAVQRLQDIDFSDLPFLDDARDRAVLSVTQELGGGPDLSFVQRLGKLFKGKDNVLFDALAFGSACQNFFSSFQQFINAIASKNRQSIDSEQRVIDIAGNDQMHAAVRKFISFNFKPKGSVFSRFGKGWKKYIAADGDAIVDGIMNLRIGQLQKIVTQVKPIAGETARAAQSVAGSAQPTGQPTAGLDDQPAGAGGEEPYKQAWKQIKSAVGPIQKNDEGLIVRVLRALEKQGYLTKQQ